MRRVDSSPFLQARENAIQDETSSIRVFRSHRWRSQGRVLFLIGILSPSGGF